MIEEFRNEEPKRQVESGLIPSSKLLVKCMNIKSADLVDAIDTDVILKAYLVGKTNCKIVENIEEADFY